MPAHSPTRRPARQGAARRPNARARLAAAAMILAALCFAGGCGSTSKLYRAEYLDQGYTIFLPGILGRDYLNPGVPKGLADADAPTAVELYDWTKGPAAIVYNLRAEKRNRREAEKLARRIVAYQDQYPGRPVHLIGHSGGAGLAVMTLEALPEDRKITSAILLGPALAYDYDLRIALSRTESGIHNYYSRLDVAILMGITRVMGTMEGRHAPTAGAIGFQTPKQLDDDQRRQYEQALAQHEYTIDMLGKGHLGGHFGWTSSPFVQHWLAPHVIEPSDTDVRLASHADAWE